ncbi:MAG: MMPL family transporter [Clostridia bacterium]|nr:MMPL family transporter [Clostridia bacterium]
MRRVSAAIIKGRFIVIALFVLAVVFCIFAMKWVRVNAELTSYLPPSFETRRGLSIMDEEFPATFAADFMVKDVTLEEAGEIAEKIRGTERVLAVVFDGTEDDYKEPYALFAVTFDGPETDPGIKDAVRSVRACADGKEICEYSGLTSAYSDTLAREMIPIVAIAVAVIVAAIVFTSRSFFEIALFAVVFTVAAVLNMGTNFIFGEIGAITNSVAVILQLALAIDYAIILTHRYQDEAKEKGYGKEALIEALSRSIVEISSSCLTTVAGLLALTLMQFRLGYDLGIVLAKGILCSMLTVFLLMPCLISLTSRAIEKTRHRSFVPDVGRWARFLSKRGIVFVVIFAVLLPLAAFFSSRVGYAFSNKTVDPVAGRGRDEGAVIDSVFGYRTPVAILVPGGDYEKENELVGLIGEIDGVRSVAGLPNVGAEGVYLTDPVSADELASLAGVGAEEAKTLFSLYGRSKGLAGDAFEVPLCDLLSFYFRNFELPEGEAGDLASLVRSALALMKGERHDRIVLTVSLPVEGEDSRALVDALRDRGDSLYGEGETVVIGDITSARDLEDSFRSDRVLIGVLSVFFVLAVLLFTFRSVAGSVLLVAVIQGSIWLGFAVSYFTRTRAVFVTEMITTAVQMGATIDYAIVLMNRYLHNRESLPKKDAMIAALRESFPTVLTSGTIMTVAGFLIAFGISDVYVGHIGLAVGRGAAISAAVVLTVLPPLLVLFDRAIIATTFSKRRKTFKK